MSLLQFLILVTSFIFLLLAIDLYARKKFNLLHFFVFFGGTLAIVVFVFRPDLLTRFGEIFGLARGADLIVYMAIILLSFVYFVMINQQTKTNYQLTRLCSSQALDSFAHSDQFAKLQEKARSDRTNIGFLMRAHNESAHISAVIDEIIEAGYTKIVVVDDGSEDATPTILRRKQIEHEDKHLYVIRHLINRGGGAANKTLFQFAGLRDQYLGVDWRVTIDGDGQMDIADLPKFIAVAEQGEVDLVLGSRFVDGGKASHIPWMRRMLLRIAKIISFQFSGMRISDPFNGYRMIRSDIIDQIHLTSDNLTYATELISLIKRNKWRFREVGVEIRYSEYTLFRQKTSFFTLLRTAWDFVYKHIFYR